MTRHETETHSPCRPAHAVDHRRLPASQSVVWALFVGCLLLLGVVWSISSPIAASPDDEFHLASAWCGRFAAEELCLDIDGEAPSAERQVLIPSRIGPQMACFRFDSSVSAACQDEVPANEMTSSRANNGLYPGGYYSIMSLFASDSPTRSVVIMRLVTWMLSIAMILASASLADRPLRRSYLLGVLATSIPLSVFLFASNNPSGVAIAGVGAFWCAANCVLRAPGRFPLAAAALVAGVSALLAISARGDAGLYVAASAACVVIIQRGWRPGLLGRSSTLVAVAAVGLLVALSADQSSGAASGMGAEGARPLTAVIWYNLTNLPSLWMGALGTWGLGWLDTAMPAGVSFAMLLVAGSLVFMGVSQLDRLKLVAIAICVSIIAVLPLLVFISGRSIVGEYVQPRYLLPMLTVLFGVLLQAVPGMRQRSMTKGQVIWLLGLPTFAHSLALHANIRRYVTGQNVIGFDLGHQSEWWWSIPIGPLAVWLTGTLLFAGCVILGGISCSSNLSSPQVRGPLADPPTGPPDGEMTPSTRSPNRIVG